MELQQVLHMTGGEGKTSYALNSTYQRAVITKARPFLQNTIKELFNKTSSPSLAIADLGCSSGPNSILVISDIVNTIHTESLELGLQSPELHVFLNDLPGNDFNTLFKMIPKLYEQQRKEGDASGHCYIAGVPGSFYGRLFPNNTLWFVHSSYSLHWISRVPKGIESNKGNIYKAKTSPPCVLEAYRKQFHTDFSLFLSSRALEMISGGRMFLTVIGRRSSNPSSKECCRLWELLAKSLQDMVTLGLVEEATLNSFNMPFHHPSPAEIVEIVEKEGSFDLDLLDTFDLNWDPNDDPQNKDFVFDKVTSGKNVAKIIRAISESILVNHFGKEMIDELFNRYAEHVGDQLVKQKIKHVNIIICMTKKC